MGSSSSSSAAKKAPLQERLNTGRGTGRLRLLASDDVEKVLSSPELKKLKSLDLSSCNLKVLPAAIGENLVNLQTLKLNDNPKLSNLPVELHALTCLRRLDCTNCTSLNSLEVLPRCIEELELCNCKFEGFIEHPHLPLSLHLIKLDLSNNAGIVGFGPAFGFEILENLVELNLNNTGIVQVPPEIGAMKQLSILRLENTFVETLPSSLFTSTRISRLELRGTKLTKDKFLALEGVDVFMKRRKERLDRDIAGGVLHVDTTLCGLD